MYKIIVHFSYDVIFTAGADVILKKFKDFNSRVVFSAEGFCWPDVSLSVSYLHPCPGPCLPPSVMHNFSKCQNDIQVQ